MLTFLKALLCHNASTLPLYMDICVLLQNILEIHPKDGNFKKLLVYQWQAAAKTAKILIYINDKTIG